MLRLTRNLLTTSVLALALLSLPPNLQAQSYTHSKRHPPAEHNRTALSEAGNDVFGTIQEVIRQLEADPATDWSAVNLEALRQHLIDMRNFTLKVDVVSRESLSNGLQLVVESTTPEAGASLNRVLNAHPSMLEQETGWEMEVKALSPGRYQLQVTSPRPADAAKIQGLGYIGLMAYGSHHKHHHWMIATGKTPHGKAGRH